MPKAQDYHLSTEELKAIEQAIKHDRRPEVVQRCIAIRLLHLGHKPEQVAKMQAVSKPTIYGWFHRWQRGGVEALANLPKSGRPPKADDK
jgi:transposase